MLGRGMPSHLCTAVYHPAARVRLMATSTGIMSATASLLAMTLRRIPLPACGTQGHSHPLQAGLRFSWQDSSSMHWALASTTASFFFCCRLFGFCDSKDGSLLDPTVLHFQGTPGNMMMSVLCTTRKAGTLNLTQHGRNTQGKKCIWICCCKVPSVVWKLHFLKWHRQTKAWVFLRDCSHFGNDTRKKVDYLSLGCIHTLLFSNTVC